VTPSVAVVGAGAWGRNHVRTLHELGALGGVVETSRDLRDRLRQTYPDVPVWSGLEEALERVDGLVIATPAATHAGLAIQALEAGKGVLVEKPMTLDLRQAQAVQAAARASGATLMVGHLLLYQPALQELKHQLDSGAIGSVLRIHQERLNHGRVRSTENVLWSFTPHDVAVLFHLMGGPPESVQACGAAFLQSGQHDDVHLELAFPGGRSAHIHASWYWPGKQRGLRVLGDQGMVVYEEGDQSLTLHRKHLRGGAGPDRLEPVDHGQVLLFLGDGEALRREDQHFLDCLATGAPPLSDGQSGVDVIRVLERAEAQLQAGILSLTEQA